MSEELIKKSKFSEAVSKLRFFTNVGIKLSIIIIFAVFAWRLAWSNFSFDLSRFDFSDLLAMILALFAIGMSVAFYFKSTDSSNQFYDNIYNFTQKTSEILGRIEERFGERLKHLDEGYGRIQSQFYGKTKSPDEIEEKVKETEGKEEKEKEKLEEANKQMQKLMETLTERAKLEQKEKEEFYAKLQQLESEKNKSQKRIREIEEDRNQMRQQLMMMEEGIFEVSPELEDPYMREIFHHPEILQLISQRAPIRIIKIQFRRILSQFPEEFIERFRETGIINSHREITPAGVMLLRSVARKYGVKF